MLALFGLLLYACRAWDYGHALVCQQTSGSERWRWRMRKLTCAMTASKCRAMVGPAHWYPSLLGHLHWHHRENLRWVRQPQLVPTVNPVFVSPGGGLGEGYLTAMRAVSASKAACSTASSAQVTWRKSWPNSLEWLASRAACSSALVWYN